jgi:hypothetical protein
MKPGAYVVVALLLLSAAGCSRRGDSKDLAALDAAYKAGVLTKDEYAARKAAIQAQSAQLVALDRAREAGLLTQDEYAAKKAALLASAPQPTAAVAPAGAAASAAPAAAPMSEPVAQPSEAQARPTAEAAQPQAGAASSVDPQGHAYRMKLAKVVDAQGFGQPITSLSVLIPVDWQSQGATTWNIKDSCNTIQTHLVATGPDGRGFENFPAYTWAWADDPKFLKQTFAQKAQFGTHACDVMPPMSAQDYLRRNLSRIRPNAQLVGYEPAPKLLESLQAQAQQTEQAARQYNLKQKVTADAARARVRYSLDGKSVEEWIFAGIVVTGNLGPSWNQQTMQPTQAWSYSCVAYTGAQHAPQGQLDTSVKLFELIGSTYRTNPEWQAKITQNALAMQKIDQKGIRDRSAIIAKSAEDTRNTQREMYENRQRSEDAISIQRSQTMRGVESYQNPSTGEKVELDSNYGHAWVNNQGIYLLTDQAGFDPNTVQGNTANWTQLQQVKK